MAPYKEFAEQQDGKRSQDEKRSESAVAANPRNPQSTSPIVSPAIVPSNPPSVDDTRRHSSSDLAYEDSTSKLRRDNDAQKSSCYDRFCSWCCCFSNTRRNSAVDYMEHFIEGEPRVFTMPT